MGEDVDEGGVKVGVKVAMKITYNMVIKVGVNM